jgi:hypothetical protein
MRPSTKFKNISTNTTVSLGGPGTVLKQVNVNVVGTTSYVSFYDVDPVDATGTPSYGYVGRYPTTAIGKIDMNHRFARGLCVLTAGGAAADITTLYGEE